MLDHVIPGASKKAYKVNQAYLQIDNVNQKYLTILKFYTNLKFELSFARTHPVLREIWLFEHEFQARNFGQFRIFRGIKICQQTVHKIARFRSHFQIKLKWADKTSYFLARNKFKISRQSSKNKNNRIKVSFDGFYCEILTN